MYKDKEQQKEANRLASQRRRDKSKGMTREGMTEQGMTQGCILEPDTKVYCRQAVTYNIAEPWDTRPQPLNVDDVPVLNNRGRYARTDGTVYQFDAGGRVFECVHAYRDHKGKPHLAVYETAEDVRQAVSA